MVDQLVTVMADVILQQDLVSVILALKELNVKVSLKENSLCFVLSCI